MVGGRSGVKGGVGRWGWKMGCSGVLNINFTLTVSEGLLHATYSILYKLTFNHTRINTNTVYYKIG